MVSTDRGVVFDRLAGIYDATGVEFFRPVARRLLDLVDPRPGVDLLDVGCGRGAVLFPAAERVGPGGTVVGIDIAEPMVRATAAEAAERGLGTVSVRLGDGADPAFPAGSFDVVTASMSAALFPDLPAVAARYARLLRPDGRIGLTGPVPPPSLREWALGPLRVGAVVDAIAPEAVAATHPRIAALLGAHPFGAPGAVADALRAAGFVEVRELHEDLELRAPSAEALVGWTWSNGLRVYWELVEPDRRAAVAAELVRDLTAHAAGGPITATYPVAYVTGRLRPAGGTP